MRRWEGGDPGVVNQKTPTMILLTPSRQFHSFGFTARDFYHDLDQTEAANWLYFEKFKMTLHHCAVRFILFFLSLVLSPYHSVCSGIIGNLFCGCQCRRMCSVAGLGLQRLNFGLSGKKTSSCQKTFVQKCKLRS